MRYALLAVTLLSFLANPLPPAPAAGAPLRQGGAEVSGEANHDSSPPLRDMRGQGTGDARHEKPLRLLPSQGPPSLEPDHVLQRKSGQPLATTGNLALAGVGDGDYGFQASAAPPDTNGAVGAAQYVQWTNGSFAVFDKTTGAILPGFPKAGNALWAGFGGGCEANNDGDPIAQYDKLADRWVMTQFSISTRPFLQCVAVSKTSDATGPYNRYSFSYGNQFNDYPKLGVWPDGYYISYNIFNEDGTFAGAKICAFERSAMLSGAAATQQCFQLGPDFGGLLPSDTDGRTPPPAGSPNYFLNFGKNSLNVWKFHVDWSDTTKTELDGPTLIPVASFHPACNGEACIPQRDISQRLDSLGDRLMYRLAYRNRGGTESLVVNHSVSADGSVAIRWYELRVSSGNLSVFQQGTYAPDSNFRWMGSIAMDKTGNIALAYSVSSGKLFPSIAFTGRLAGSTEPLGIMAEETILKAGGGAQLRELSRWGDYSALTVDPVDDCTFWYTTEYLKSSGTFNWSTWIASFRFPDCR